jgi:hypothetical protein
MIAGFAPNFGITSHNSTVALPERVLGPTDDEVTFFQPRGLVFVTMLWVIALAWLGCRVIYLLVLLALGTRPTADDIASNAESLLVVPFVAAGLIILVAWRSLGHLHSSVHGLRFAATGRRAVFLPWSAVAAVGLRHRGPFTELIVTPTSADAATMPDGPRLRRRPRSRRRGGATEYLVDVGLMSPGPQVLLAELHRRIPGKV